MDVVFKTIMDNIGITVILAICVFLAGCAGARNILKLPPIPENITSKWVANLVYSKITMANEGVNFAELIAEALGKKISENDIDINSKALEVFQKANPFLKPVLDGYIEPKEAVLYTDEIFKKLNGANLDKKALSAVQAGINLARKVFMKKFNIQEFTGEQAVEWLMLVAGACQLLEDMLKSDSPATLA
jgi:hypothetical protein